MPEAGSSRRLQKKLPGRAAFLYGCSAIFVPVGPELSGKGTDAVVGSFLFHDAVQGGFDIRILDQQAHAAGEFSLNGPGRRCDPVFHPVDKQQVPQSQTLLIIHKEDIPADVGISH